MNSRFEFLLILGGRPITRAFKDASFNRGTLDNVWNIKKKPSKVEGHSASFPVELVNKILKSFGQSGCKVIDPFLGTGTTAIACQEFGAEFTGVELDEDYFKAACDRIKSESLQMSLFS